MACPAHHLKLVGCPKGQQRTEKESKGKVTINSKVNKTLFMDQRKIKGEVKSKGKDNNGKKENKLKKKEERKKERTKHAQNHAYSDKHVYH